MTESEETPLAGLTFDERIELAEASKQRHRESKGMCERPRTCGGCHFWSGFIAALHELRRAALAPSGEATEPTFTIHWAIPRAALATMTGEDVDEGLREMRRQLNNERQQERDAARPHQEQPPQFVCGPTCGCGKSFDMVPAMNVFPPAWTLPAACPHCGQAQVSKIFIHR